MANEVHDIVVYLLNITFTSNALWLIFPLVIATLVMTIYFERYKYEHPGWNTFTANSLVLLFVSVDLLRFIFSIGDHSAINYVMFPGKTIAAALLFFLGISLLRFNFNHVLPEKIAQYLSSPLTLSVLAYVVILYVFSDLENSVRLFIALAFILSIVLLMFALIRIPLSSVASRLRRMKETEKIKTIEKEKNDLKKLRTELSRREKTLHQVTLKNIAKQKKEVKKLRDVVKKR